jgi:hypothetical protein
MELTTASLFKAIEEVVAETGPDYVYEAPVWGECLYVHEGTPSCLFGKALAKHGADTSFLEYADNGHWGLYDLPEEYGFSEGAAKAFQNAQSQQDSKEPYGRVLELLRLNLKKLGEI